MITKTVIGVIGLGYVGLPVALAFAEKYSTIGFDIDDSKIEALRLGVDVNREQNNIAQLPIYYTSDQSDLNEVNFYIVAVPTDVDENKVPVLTPLESASRLIGQSLNHGDTVVYESTVYPGCTEEVCKPILEEYSGLQCSKGFSLGYSPERISPGDKKHTFKNVVKIVAGDTVQSTNVIAKVYQSILYADVVKASSIKHAEASKIIENTQRDLNISLMNEMSMVFDNMNININEVIDLACTKWNFHRYYPGLVGGHCISVDPYYLLHKARELGVEPQVIAAGRRVNDNMPSYVAKKIVQKVIAKGLNPGQCSALVLGITFKPNISDFRNSKTVDLVNELMDFGLDVQVCDNYINPELFKVKYPSIKLGEPSKKYELILLAVNHLNFVEAWEDIIDEFLLNGGIAYKLWS